MGRVAAALRALTGRGPRASALLRPPEEVAPVARADEEVAPDAEPVEVVEVVESVESVETPSPSGEEAAALIDAARERLRATIARPADDDPA